MDFLRGLADPRLSFLRYAALAGLLSSVSFGMVGTFVVARRIAFLAGAIAHSVLGGIGVALYLQKAVGLEWCEPMYGAVAAALASALTIGLVSMYAQEREDSIIGAIWAVGMAVGLLFIAKTPGYVDPMSYLFGNILLLTGRDLWTVLVLDAVAVALCAVFYNKLLAVCFDEEFALVRGVRVQFYYLLLLCLTALTVVLLIPVVGIVLVIALLIVPAAIAGQVARRLWQMMALSVLLCALFTGAGLAVSYEYELLTGPTVIVLAGLVYLAVMIGARVRRSLAA